MNKSMNPDTEPTVAISGSKLFAWLADNHASVEIWKDEGFGEEGWSYFNIVSSFDEGNVRLLAYVRLRGGELQKRTYDAAGDDLWLATE